MIDRTKLASCKTKYEVYCMIFKNVELPDPISPLDVYINLVEETLAKLGIIKHTISKSDIKRAVSDCVYERQWQYTRTAHCVNDIKIKGE